MGNWSPGAHVLRKKADGLAERIGHEVNDLAIPVLDSFFDQRPLCCLHEHAIRFNPAHQLVLKERVLHTLLRMHIVDLHIVDFPGLGALRQGLHQSRRLADRLSGC